MYILSNIFKHVLTQPPLSTVVTVSLSSFTVFLSLSVLSLDLIGTELRWRTMKMFAKHGKHIDIREVNVVSTGI